MGWCAGTISDIDGSDVEVNYVEDGKVSHTLLDFDIAKYGTVWVHLTRRPRHADRQASPVGTPEPMALAGPTRQLETPAPPTSTRMIAGTQTDGWKMKTVKAVGGIKPEPEPVPNDAVVPANGHALDRRSVSSSPAPPDTDQCGVCKESTDLEDVVCDGCDAEYHLHCLTPPVKSVDDLPAGDWFCSKCAIAEATDAEGDELMAAEADPTDKAEYSSGESSTDEEVTLYKSAANDTLKKIADDFEITVDDLVFTNKARYPGLTKKSEIWDGTLFIIPYQNDPQGEVATDAVADAVVPSIADDASADAAPARPKLRRRKPQTYRPPFDEDDATPIKAPTTAAESDEEYDPTAASAPAPSRVKKSQRTKVTTKYDVLARKHNLRAQKRGLSRRPDFADRPNSKQVRVKIGATGVRLYARDLRAITAGVTKQERLALIKAGYFKSKSVPALGPAKPPGRKRKGRAAEAPPAKRPATGMPLPETPWLGRGFQWTHPAEKLRPTSKEVKGASTQTDTPWHTTGPALRAPRITTATLKELERNPVLLSHSQKYLDYIAAEGLLPAFAIDGHGDGPMMRYTLPDGTKV